jgi:hypothetical protein
MILLYSQMLKRILFLMAVVLNGFTYSIGQQVFDKAKFEIDKWYLKPVKDKLTLPTLSELEILDARPDTFCVGFSKKDALKPITQKPLSQYFAIGLNNSLENEFKLAFQGKNVLGSSGYKLLVVINDFWMYENVDPSDFIYQTTPYSCAVLFRADVYLKRNLDYIPLLKIDSIYGISKGLKYAKDKLMDSLHFYFAKKLNDCPIQRIFEKATKTKSKASIDSFYKSISVFVKPSVPDTSRQYVFKTFQHFKNGVYENANFRVVSDNFGDFIYKKESDGQEILARDYIFYDNGKWYLNRNDTFSEIVFSGNRAYTISCRMIMERSVPIPNMDLRQEGFGSPGTGNMEIMRKVKKSYQPMMLDMVTGNTY